ncbi:MAG TPA: hypothetical protein VG497_30660 [Kribbella sp.]|nr:hypothetical protein [Kribbella sp.]
MIEKYIRPVVKALGSGTAAAVPTAIAVADKGVTLVEWLMILGAFLAGAGFTYVLPANKPYEKG